MKALPEVNKQVGGVISNVFFSKQILILCAAINIKSYNSISFSPIATKFDTIIVSKMHSKMLSGNLENRF